jgi:hypothetical protein
MLTNHSFYTQLRKRFFFLNLRNQLLTRQVSIFNEFRAFFPSLSPSKNTKSLYGDWKKKTTQRNCTQYSILALIFTSHLNSLNFILSAAQ